MEVGSELIQIGSDPGSTMNTFANLPVIIATALVLSACSTVNALQASHGCSDPPDTVLGIAAALAELHVMMGSPARTSEGHA